MVGGSNLPAEKHQLLLQTDAVDAIIAKNSQKSPEGLQALKVLESIHDELARFEVEQEQ